MLLSRFTVLCSCGICLRGLSILHAWTFLIDHRRAQLLPDETYDAIRDETLAQAEAVLAMNKRGIE